MDSFDESSVFLAALNLREEDRQAFLSGACPNQESLDRVQELLRSHVAGFSAVRPLSETQGQIGDGDLPSAIGPFRIIRELGRGGMGVVYLAADDTLGRRVALKVLGIHLERSPSAVDGLHREAKTAAALTHSGIVPVYQFGFDGNRCFIASEYVEGPTLRQLIDDQRAKIKESAPRLASRDWLVRSGHILSSLAETLEFCHRRNVIHRDVKPSNVLVDPESGPRLTDFGIAIATGVPWDVGTAGTYYYMSPEQATQSSAKIDARSDVFSLGIVMYEMLALQRPFEGENPEKVVAHIRDLPEASLRSIDRSLPVDLHTICHKCLEKRPVDRYQTAAHVAAELRCWMAGEPILARPPKLMRRAVRVLRRHKISCAIIATVLVAGTATTAIVVTHQHTSSGRIVIPESMKGAEVTCERLKEDGGCHDESIQLGRAPLERYLDPGLYLLTFRYPNGTKLEAVTLQAPGRTDRVEMNRPNPEYIRTFVLAGAGDYKVGIAGYPTADRAERSIRLGAMHVSPTEVTNREYRAFRQAGLGSDAKVWRQPYDNTEDDLPVSGISWDQANEYCRWRGVRMPTAVEWEAVARAPDGRLYPWGSAPKPEIFRNESTATEAYHTCVRPVQDDSGLQSPLGLSHLNSNVAEFVASIAEELNNSLVVKGRSYRSETSTSLDARSALPGRQLFSPDIGFRVMIRE